jgi:hypothetical protein
LRFSGLILENIFMVFLSSSCRDTAKKRDKKIEGGKRQENSFYVFFVKSFWHGFPPNFSNGVFELALLRNAHQKH